MNWNELQAFKREASIQTSELSELILGGLNGPTVSTDQYPQTRDQGEESISTQLAQVPLPIQSGVASLGAKALQRLVFGKITNPILRFVITTATTILVTKCIAEMKRKFAQ